MPVWAEILIGVFGFHVVVGSASSAVLSRWHKPAPVVVPPSCPSPPAVLFPVRKKVEKTDAYSFKRAA